MNKLLNMDAHKVCYFATLGTFFGAISEREFLQWTGVVIASGAAIFTWGIGRYHEYRKQRREEDHIDRLKMTEDMQTQIKMLYDMEIRQKDLKKAMDTLIFDIEHTKGQLVVGDDPAKGC